MCFSLCDGCLLKNNIKQNICPKYDFIMLVQLENGVELSFTDKRRFARVRLLNDVRLDPILLTSFSNFFLCMC